MSRKSGAAVIEPPTEEGLEFEWVPRQRLRPWVLNPNKGDPMGIAGSIKAFGWGRPIIANRHPGLEGEILIGHHALEAAELLSNGAVPGEWKNDKARAMAEKDLVPVRWVSLPAKQAHALSLADNQWGSKGHVDDDKLGKVVGLDELEAEDWMAAGFAEKDIKSLMFTPWPSLEGHGQTAQQLKFSIIIDCTDEGQQTELLERFEAEGITCKPWVG